MILLSLILVIAAAVLLVVGWFQDGLSLIYLSIGACLLAMLLLGASVLLRRRDRGPAPTSPIASGTAPVSAASASTRRTAVVRRPETDTDTQNAADAAAAPASDAVGTAPVDATSDDAPSQPEPDADPLADVRGLGPSRRETLLEHFGTLDAIRDASLEELTAVPGISPGLAKAVQRRLA